MRLYHTPTSPFVRKVMVAAHERDLAARITTTFLRPTPTQVDAELSQANPLSKIPALVLDDGSTLYDSRVIVEYLDGLHGGAPLVPRAGAERFRVLRLQALCDGILDAAILVFYERAQRPKELHWEAWLRGQTQKAEQGLDRLEHEVEGFAAEGPVDLAQICAGVTVGWLEFRAPLGDVRARRPKLARWFARFCERPSMVATAPSA